MLKKLSYNKYDAVAETKDVAKPSTIPEDVYMVVFHSCLVDCSIGAEQYYQKEDAKLTA